MRTRIVKGLLVITAVSGFAGLPAVAAARHGADDGVRHHVKHHHRHGADDRPGDDRGAR